MHVIASLKLAFHVVYMLCMHFHAYMILGLISSGLCMYNVDLRDMQQRDVAWLSSPGQITVCSDSEQGEDPCMMLHSKRPKCNCCRA